MRVLVVDTYYPAFLRQLYAGTNGLAELPYSQQAARIMEQRFAVFDAYERGLNAAGCEARTIIANCPPLQWAWLEERRGKGFRHLPQPPMTRYGLRAARSLLRRIVVSQALDFGPDVIYVTDPLFFSVRTAQRLRSICRLLVAQIGSPVPSLEQFVPFDFTFLSLPELQSHFTSAGLAWVNLPLAFDSVVLDDLRASGLEPTADADRPRSVVFVGGIGRLHEGRTELLEHVARNVPLQVWGYGRESLSSDSPLRPVHRGPAWGLDMYRVFAQAKIVLNRHADFAGSYANNMRLFEATGCGALLLTERRRNLSELFAEDEVATYNSPEEAVHVIQRALGDDKRRVAQARAGQARTLADHSYARRMGQAVVAFERRLRPCTRDM